MLLDRDGMPMFDPTVFTLTELRGRNRSSNTIGIALRSLMVFYLFLDARDIDLDARLAAGTVLSLSEVDDLVRLCRLTIRDLAAMSGLRKGSVPKVMSLEGVRMGAHNVLPEEVEPDVAASRLRYIRMYLQWLAGERQSRQGFDPTMATRLRDSFRFVAGAIETRIPRKSGRDVLDQREGLTDEAKDELLRVIDPHSPDNPWRDQHTRYRNALLVHWLLFLGLRIGEALGVRIGDIVAYQKEVTIHRRADDPDDPRLYQPQTKTRARVLSLSESLLHETQAYILNHRRTLPGAKKHPFLFVASRTGRPMTLIAVGKMFKELRERCPSLPKELSAHVLRHTWNDDFSKEMDRRCVAPEIEHQSRSYLMGWSPTSNTAAVYTRRHVRNKANEVSLELQSQLAGKTKNDE